LQVFVVEHDGLSFRTAAGNGVLRGAALHGVVAPLHGGDAWGKLNQLLKVASVQRQFTHLLFGGASADGRIRRFDSRCLAFHGDGLLLLANRKREIDDGLRADGQRDSLANHGLEAGFGCLDLVITDIDIGNAEAALIVRGNGLCNTSSHIFRFHRGCRNGGA